MFRKLLKYDLYSVFKYWWIAAVSSLGVSVLGGICLKIITAEHTAFKALQAIAVFGLILSIIGISAFSVLATVLVMVRFYKNFFSDEGYLTFTLPVTKAALLNSKVVMAAIFTTASALILLIDVFIMLGVGVPQYVFDASVFKEFSKVLSSVIKAVGGGYIALYVIEFIIAIMISQIYAILLLMVSVTVGSMIAKKHKVIASVAAYYFASGIISGIGQYFVLDTSLIKAFEKLSYLSVSQLKFTVAVGILALCGFTGIIATAVYILETWLLDRKLNLE